MAKGRSGSGRSVTTPAVAARVQSKVARSSDGKVSSGSQAARMQAAAARNTCNQSGK